ncbi:MAG: ATP synthase F1 subunit gamma [Gammaproteobacteria bacterium]|nr:ATP synthase F1 subunit gamma [Gammaproteobacteria bacterium]
MPGARDVKRRIRSVENTRQITRTMELVATSKLKRATDRVNAARPYSEALSDIVSSLHAPEYAEYLPVLRRPERVRRAAILLTTANRGLAGAFNANLIREGRQLLEKLRDDGVEVDLHLAGRKGLAYFRFRGEPIASSRTDISDDPTVADAESLSGSLREAFEAGEIDAVYLISSEFRSAMSTPPRTRQLLPLQPSEGALSPEAFILSPTAVGVLRDLIPLYLRNMVYRALVENAAAEQGARRTAMKNATDNAGEMIEHLTRTYNRARQAQITQEIAEIVGGAEGVG